MSKLALDGGTPVRTTPFPMRDQIDDREIAAINRVVERARTAGGAFERYGGVEVDAYEAEFAAHMGCKYGNAVSHGTGSVHTALGALRLDAGSEVICSPITDPGAIMPVLLQNCIPVFADADPETQNMDPASVHERLTSQTKAIVCGHIAGQPCDMDAIMEIAREHNLWVIEDCAQAHDAEWRGKKAGSIGHMGCYSLMSGKHSTAGGQGGMVVTNDEDLYWQAKRFADRGKPFNSDAPGNMFVGINYRMTELGAAIGRVQLEKLPEIVAVRRRCAQVIEETLVEAGTEGVQMGEVIEGAKSAYWFIFLRWHADRMSVDKAKFCEAVGAEGVGVAANYGALAMLNPYTLEHKAYGNSDCPWCCPLWEKQGNVDYANCCPKAVEADFNLMRTSVHESFSDDDARDVGLAIAKVEAAYRK
ncbi:MAG: DegT/DnrJ/EryC1/StrS family aminotransferase [Armatimonadetes bacterium]|nr:DegT/DnrJ/EryC1/StrS family aminotransferase [Armatimonadota bacterium]